MLVTKKAPEFKTQAVMPDNSIQDVSLSDYSGKKSIIFLSIRFHFCLPNRTFGF